MTEKAFILTDNPGILAQLDSAKTQAERTVLLKNLAFLAKNLGEQYAAVLKDRQAKVDVDKLTARVVKLDVTKQLATATLEAHKLGLPGILLHVVDATDKTGKPVLRVKAKVASVVTATGRKKAQGFTFRGVTYAPGDMAKALATVDKGDPLYAAVALVNAAHGKGSIHKVMTQRGWSLPSTGKPPSAGANYNRWQALKCLARNASGPNAPLLKALKAEIRWTFG